MTTVRADRKAAERMFAKSLLKGDARAKAVDSQIPKGLQRL